MALWRGGGMTPVEEAVFCRPHMVVPRAAPAAQGENAVRSIRAEVANAKSPAGARVSTRGALSAGNQASNALKSDTTPLASNPA